MALTRYEFDRFVTLATKGPKLDTSFEIQVDGVWEEIVELPAVRLPCVDEDCGCRSGTHLVADDAVIGQFPEIARAVAEEIDADVEYQASARATRRAEQGWADA